MPAILPDSFGRRHDIPLRHTYRADLVIAYIMQAIQLTADERKRLMSHITDSHERVDHMRQVRQP